MTMRGLLVVGLLAALLVAVRSFPVAQELINEESEGDNQYEEVEIKPDVMVKRDEVAGSGSGAARKDDVAAAKTVAEEAPKKDNPQSDESESPASGEEETSGDDSTDVAASGNSDNADEDDWDDDKEKRAVPEGADDAEDKEEDTGSGADEGSTPSTQEDTEEDKGQEAEVKKTKVTNVSGTKRCCCWEKEKDDKEEEKPEEEHHCKCHCKCHEKEDEKEEKKPDEEHEHCKRECECEEEEPEEEHEHCHHCHGHEEGCHGCHECEHHHCDDQGHHEHDDCCHHHGHHHGFVHEWGEECCGDHDCHDCCGEHEHEHHDEGDHHHEHCCHDNHCCHHKEEEKRSKLVTKDTAVAVAMDTDVAKGDTTKREMVPPSPVVKKQTVHVGYGYASGDNYRLGYQQGGMGGLASTFTGQIGAEQQGSYDAADHYNKREPSYHPGPIREKRFYGGHAFGNMESGIAHGSATPYGHPVTHPGFTTMGFPGHALASQDVRARIAHPQMKRSIVIETGSYPYAGYAWALPYGVVTSAAV